MWGVVVMNYHGYLVLRGGRREGGWAYDLFDPWVGPLSTRFAATFVLTAGVGVTLMTASSRGDHQRTVDMRWRLARRGLLLYGGGLLFDFIWPGTILPFYGAMFVLAAGMFTVRNRWLLAVGATAAVAAWLIAWWVRDREAAGHDTSWLTNPGSRSPRGLVLDVFVNGTHPLLPWLAFFCAGILLGRVLRTTWWQPACILGGITLFGGVLILVGAVAMTKFQRVYEAAILRTLGASARTLTAMLAWEYTTLGLLAGVIGASGALALTWAVCRFVFEIDWSPSPGILITGALVTTLLVSVIGVIASGDVLRKKPLATLRAE